MLLLTTYIPGSLVAQGATLEEVSPETLYDAMKQSTAENALLVYLHIPLRGWLEWAFNVRLNTVINAYTNDLIERCATIYIDVHPAVHKLQQLATIDRAYQEGYVRFYWLSTREMAATAWCAENVLQDVEYQRKAVSYIAMR